MLYPEVQEKIHQETDGQIGVGRIPTANEIESFEYLNAAWKESMRLNATTPLGILSPFLPKPKP
jgi:cytochrome P450